MSVNNTASQRVVLLCESYASIAYTLYWLERADKTSQVTIFLANLNDLYLLFQDINKKVFNGNLKLIYYPKYESMRSKAKGLGKILYIFRDILGEKSYLKQFHDKHFAGLKDAEVFFSSPGYSGVKAYILQKLSKRNKLIFVDPGPPYMGKYYPRTIRDIVVLLTYKMIYGKNVELGQFPGVNPWDKDFPLLKDSFMKSSVKKVIDWSERDEIMKTFPWEKFRVLYPKTHKVIYFHQDLVGRDVPDRHLFSRRLNDIFNIILRYYPENEVARKYHPAHELNKDVITIGEEIPAHIPAQLLYSDGVEIYLGITSIAIVNVRGVGKTISLLNLIEFKSDKLKAQQKEWLKKISRTEILFPSSMEEFERIVSSTVANNNIAEANIKSIN